MVLLHWVGRLDAWCREKRDPMRTQGYLQTMHPRVLLRWPTPALEN